MGFYLCMDGQFLFVYGFKMVASVVLVSWECRSISPLKSFINHSSKIVERKHEKKKEKKEISWKEREIEKKQKQNKTIKQSNAEKERKPKYRKL